MPTVRLFIDRTQIIDALPAGQRFYVNYRHERGNNFEGRRRGGRLRAGNSRGREGSSYADRKSPQAPPPRDDDALWPALPSAKEDDQR
jgi:hypothetical protein